MVRLVLDTNVLINADRGEYSFGKRIVDLVRWGEAVAVITTPVRRENQLIVDKLVKDRVLKKALAEFLKAANTVEPADVNLMLEDDEDIKLLEAAIGGGAHFLITDDKHLLILGAYQDVQIVTPKQFWDWWQQHQDDNGTTWQGWVSNLFRS